MDWRDANNDDDPASKKYLKSRELDDYRPTPHDGESRKSMLLRIEDKALKYGWSLFHVTRFGYF